MRFLSIKIDRLNVFFKRENEKNQGFINRFLIEMKMEDDYTILRKIILKKKPINVAKWSVWKI